MNWNETEYTNHGGTCWVRRDEAEKRIAELEAENKKLRLITVKGVPAGVDVDLYYDRWKQSEAERDKWHWVATHEFRCPLGEMSPGEPGSYIVEVPVSEALVRQWEAAEREDAP